VPFEFESFEKLGHYVIGGRLIFVKCRGWDCYHRRVLDLRRFDPEMTLSDLEAKKFRCTKCGSTKVEVTAEREREWKRRIRR